MLRLVGGCLILIGVMYGLYEWRKSRKEQMDYIKEYNVFLDRLCFDLFEQGDKIPDFCRSYQGKNTFLNNCITHLGEGLNHQMFQSTTKAWEETMLKPLIEGAYEKTLQSYVARADAIFGSDPKENKRQIKKQIKQLEAYEKDFNERDEKQKKIIIPLTVFGALLIIIILI